MWEGVDLSGIVLIENAKRSKKTKQLLISIAASPRYVKQLKYPLLYNVFLKSHRWEGTVLKQLIMLLLSYTDRT